MEASGNGENKINELKRLRYGIPSVSYTHLGNTQYFLHKDTKKESDIGALHHKNNLSVIIKSVSYTHLPPPDPGGRPETDRAGRSAQGDPLRPDEGAAVRGVHQPEEHNGATAGDQPRAEGAGHHAPQGWRTEHSVQAALRGQRTLSLIHI